MKQKKIINYFKIITIWLFSILYIYIGIKHFINPDPFMAIMPTIIPEYLHKFFVYLSGFCEIYFGILILHKEERKFGAWGLIILLLAVFPANIYLFISESARDNFGLAIGVNEPVKQLDALIRMPFQIPLILCAYWYTIENPKNWFSYLCIILFFPTIYYFMSL